VDPRGSAAVGRLNGDGCDSFGVPEAHGHEHLLMADSRAHRSSESAAQATPRIDCRRRPRREEGDYMNRRRSAIAMLAFAALATWPLAEAQPSTRPHRIGVLGISNLGASRAFLAVFTDELTKLGWIDGQNVQLIYRFADGDASRLPALAAELVSLGPDVLCSFSPAATAALARATSRIPVVMDGPADPVAMGLVKSLAHPGGNVTGTATAAGPEIYGKRLEVLTELVPGLARIALIYDPGEANGPVGRAALEDSAKRLGLRLDLLVAEDVSELRSAMDTLSRDRPGAVYLLHTAAAYTDRELVCARLARMRLPSMTDFYQYVESGCLASYSYVLEDAMRGTAQVLDQILRGANPADIPVRQVTRLELVINARTAASLGLAIPPKLRVMADRVIE
jgi:putative ABC transport system substrate-binding protein